MIVKNIRLATINISTFGTIQGCATYKTYLKISVVCIQIILMMHCTTNQRCKGIQRNTIYVHIWNKNYVRSLIG